MVLTLLLRTWAVPHAAWTLMPHITFGARSALLWEVLRTTELWARSVLHHALATITLRWRRTHAAATRAKSTWTEPAWTWALLMRTKTLLATKAGPWAVLHHARTSISARCWWSHLAASVAWSEATMMPSVMMTEALVLLAKTPHALAAFALGGWGTHVAMVLTTFPRSRALVATVAWRWTLMMLSTLLRLIMALAALLLIALRLGMLPSLVALTLGVSVRLGRVRLGFVSLGGWLRWGRGSVWLLDFLASWRRSRLVFSSRHRSAKHREGEEDQKGMSIRFHGWVSLGLAILPEGRWSSRSTTPLTGRFRFA